MGVSVVCSWYLIVLALVLWHCLQEGGMSDEEECIGVSGPDRSL